MMSGKRSAWAPSTRAAVAAALEADDREVVDLRGRDPRPARATACWSRSCSMTWLDLGVGDLVDLRRERVVGVVAELDLGPDGEGDPVAGPDHPPRSSSTRARGAAPGRRGRSPGAPRGRCARRGARGPRRGWGWRAPGRSGRRPGLARGSAGGPCPAGSRARGCGARGGGRPRRWRSGAPVAVISTSSTMVLRSASRISVFTASLSSDGWQ